ncbi:hypothetical protein AB0G48_18015 [Streptomyces rubiginosohelvolus]|uniref:hypothetical protein n=1 Tax=Streptomyces rubiginosohelvolus TaxID=67362 RepID=UPI0033F83DB9
MRVAKDGLIEREITFTYDFRMRCDVCGQTSALSGTDYLRLDGGNGARVECDQCAGSIHFGPLSAAIRNPDDPALDDGIFNRLSWYHTSTYADWPSTAYERDTREAFSTVRARALMGDTEPYLQVQLDKAFHLGTYEAAIENMYRRMRDQGDEHSAFYLHRVRIDVPPGRVNPGFHDETDEPAADISVAELSDLGLDAVRYLNVWEASGGISLAVRPHVITSIQTIPLPGALTADDHLPTEILDVVEDLERRCQEPATPTERQDLAFSLNQELEEALIACLLPEVNLKIAHDFAQAVGTISGQRDGGFRSLARLFATHAGLLHAPEGVVDLLSAAPSRQHIGDLGTDAP